MEEEMLYTAYLVHSLSPPLSTNALWCDATEDQALRMGRAWRRHHHLVVQDGTLETKSVRAAWEELNARGQRWEILWTPSGQQHTVILLPSEGQIAQDVRFNQDGNVFNLQAIEHLRSGRIDELDVLSATLSDYHQRSLAGAEAPGEDAITALSR